VADALFGYTGFVGGNLARQRHFCCLYSSANALDAWGKEFDLVVCAAAPGAKWFANQHPAEDWAKISALLETLRHIKAQRFVLISTVDVYADPSDANELTVIRNHGMSWYGVNRAMLEMYVRPLFPNALVLRLPALFGPGLKKNALFDLICGSRTEEIAPNAIYQWWPVDELSCAMERALMENLTTLNLTSDPISMSDIRDEFFPGAPLGPGRADAPHYDVRSIHPGYHLSRDEVMLRIGEFVRT
jgi:nucleoside-diphosphate-sugar epimerase